MKFSRILGKIDDSLVKQAEDRLSSIFLELGTRYNNEHVGSGMGGDALIFGLMYPIEHVATLNMPTAATDGKRFYWNPKFVMKKSKIGLRIICSHEAWHAIYMHPQRRGSRLPKLWNIAVDYIVNGNCMDDFKARKMDAKEMFNKHLGKYMTLSQYVELLKDPFAPQKDFGDLQLDPMSPSVPRIELPPITEDRELTEEEQKELERREQNVKFYFADPDLEEDMKRPEKIYDLLYNLLPKCPNCGSIGIYKKPKKDQSPDKSKGKNKDKSDKKDQSGKPDKKNKKSKKNKGDQPSEDGSPQDGQGDNPGDSGENQSHDHGDGQPCDCSSPDGKLSTNAQGKPCCGECGYGDDGIDIFDLGGTVDDHMDTSESEEKLAKRISDAMECAKKMAGHVPASLEDELGILTAPKVTWQDIIRTRLLKARAGNAKNDWTRFRSRPMFNGLLVPKRRSFHCQFGCLLDTSGSMSPDDMAFGLSQLASLDEKAEGTICPADATIYWEKSTKIKKCNFDELSKVKVCGRGGTVWAPFFTDYQKNIGKCDFLIIISDLYLCDQDVANMKNPGIDVYWLCTSTNGNWTPPFGKILPLRG